MTAKEMFEELGYGVRKENDMIICENNWQKITFKDKFNIFVRPKVFMGNFAILDKYTIKAIQKQIEELGWNND